MLSFSTYAPENLSPEARSRQLSPKEIQQRLRDTGALLEDTNDARRRVLSWPQTPVKLWTISALDNRINDLVSQLAFWAARLEEPQLS